MDEPVAECIAGCGRGAVRWRLCEADGHLLAGACYGKRRNRNPHGLCQVIKRDKLADKAVYVCPVCTRWHMGRQCAGSDEVLQRREALVRAIRAAGNGWALGWLADQWADATREDRNAWKARMWQWA